MMPLKEPNPLNIFDKRRVEFLPEFFETVDMDRTYNLEESISKWITNNLKGRYFVGARNIFDGSTIVNKVTVGFENQKELSYFMLACPLLKYN